MSLCNICPRKCGADRKNKLGFCRMPQEIMLARAALHRFEEPPISGTRGSGTIFFAGCNLRCIYCQNSAISRYDAEKNTAVRAVTKRELVEIMRRLRDAGAHNINLVTPTHYAYVIAEVLSEIKNELGIPVVYNCGGYESVDTLKALEGLVDIYMPDFKYCSTELSSKYSAAPDYAEKAADVLREMYRQTGEFLIDDEGIMKKGVIVRHLVLPGERKDSAEVLKLVARTVPADKVLLSVMRQYTPDFAPENFKNLKRKITSFEYDFVISEAEKYGFAGFSQERSSASDVFTPDFSEKTF